ncbi:STAS domain-containing protein [Streptomyces sp. NPDC038707]|uniref:STAS domain-containing protein n=1 Tax=unclassified Streptomyces TaxID=2593676 RepID=UPI0033E31C85
MHGHAHGGVPGAAPGLTGPGRRTPPPSLGAAAYTPCGSRTRVSVLGELDLDSARALWPGLVDALAASASGLDLDLGGVAFCDCAGLNLLLELRRRALDQGKTIAVHAVGPAVDRVLTLIGARALLVPDAGPAGLPAPAVRATPEPVAADTAGTGA